MDRKDFKENSLWRKRILRQLPRIQSRHPEPKAKDLVRFFGALRLRMTVAIILLISVTSCIAVGDFKEYWEKGTIDKRLEGSWYNEVPTASPIKVVQDGNIYKVTFLKENNTLEARTLTVAGYTYLMMKKRSQDPGGTMSAYVVNNNKLVFFAPAKAKYDYFVKKYEGFPGLSINRTSVRVEELNQETMELLKDLSQQESLWAPYNRYRKTE